MDSAFGPSAKIYLLDFKIGEDLGKYRIVPSWPVLVNDVAVVFVVEGGAAAVAVQRGIAGLGPVGVEWQAFTVVAGLEKIQLS